MSTLASTAIPIMSTSPARPGNVKVAEMIDHERDRHEQVGEQCDAGDKASEAIVDQHEAKHGDEGEDDGNAPHLIVSPPRVGPIVLSLTGSGLSVAGKAPERRTLTVWSTRSRVKEPLISPLLLIRTEILAADSTRPSITMAICWLTFLP